MRGLEGQAPEQPCTASLTFRRSRGSSGWKSLGPSRSRPGALLKKENQIFLIYKEIQSGAVAKSYMTNGLLIYGKIFAHI
jgi:hypothetical protein